LPRAVLFRHTLIRWLEGGSPNACLARHAPKLVMIIWRAVGVC